MENVEKKQGMIRLCFLIRQFGTGGVQSQLITLAKGMDKEKYDIYILTFYDGGSLVDQIKNLPHVKYISLSKRGRWDVFKFLFNLFSQLRRIKPHLLHAYLTAPNCLTIFFKPFLRKTVVVWGVAASDMDLSYYDWLSRFLYRMECFLSRFADLIISNSKSGLEYAAINGFPKEKMVVIPNGVDLVRFKPNKNAGLKFREDWGVKEGEKVIGLVGRLDPMKDHPTFLKAAAILAKKRGDVRFVCIGGGTEQYKNELIKLEKKLNLSGRVFWSGNQSDMPSVYNAIDTVCSSSITEGLPNVIIEAMASGVPCVATNVGDIAWVIGDTGFVVPPRDPKALAEGWEKCLSEDIIELGKQARLRTEKKFSVRNLVEQTERTLCSATSS